MIHWVRFLKNLHDFFLQNFVNNILLGNRYRLPANPPGNNWQDFVAVSSLDSTIFGCFNAILKDLFSRNHSPVSSNIKLTELDDNL